MKLQLKNIKIYDKLSTDSTCFSADIYVNSKCVGDAVNDGRGGSTYITSYPEHKDLFKDAERFLAGQPDIVYPNTSNDGSFSVESNLENWVDFQVAQKGAELFQKKLAKDMLKGICYGNNAFYNLTYWKNYTLTELLNTPVGRKLIQQRVDELKTKGETILNRNLEGIIL